MVERQFERKNKTLQSNWGGEYKSFADLVQKESLDILFHIHPFRMVG